MEHKEEYLNVLFKDLYIDQKNNCRGIINVDTLKPLADDIALNGLHEPVIARYKFDYENFDAPYILVAGFTRSLAVRDILRCDSISCIVRNYTQIEALAVNLGENIQRNNLNIMQQAEGIRRFMIAGLTRERISQILGQSNGWVQPRMYLLQLPKAIQDAASGGFLTADNIRDLYSMRDDHERITYAMKIKEARQRGESAAINLKVLTKSKSMRESRAKIAHVRNRAEIHKLQDYLASIDFPIGFHSRMLAWCGGHINDLELLADIQTFLHESGVDDYYPPAFIPDVKETSII